MMMMMMMITFERQNNDIAATEIKLIHYFHVTRKIVIFFQNTEF